MAATPNVIDPYAHSHDRPRKHHVEYALTTDRASQLARARLADGDDPDAPWYCPAGAFAGSYLTAELEEVQKGDMTRKMSTSLTAVDSGKKRVHVDARPLDPQPVVRARMYECTWDGQRLREVRAEEFSTVTPGLVCNAVLYPYNAQYDRDGDLSRFSDGSPKPSPLGSEETIAKEGEYPPATLPRRPKRALPPTAAMHDALRGRTNEQAAVCAAFQATDGETAIYFVFADLKICEVGHFVLKYSMMFIDEAFLADPRVRPRVLASDWGGVFAVYPSNRAPRRAASTALSLHLHDHRIISHPRTQHDGEQGPSSRRRRLLGGRPPRGRVSRTATATTRTTSLSYTEAITNRVETSCIRRLLYDPVRDL